jgi:peptide/nickel transport system substrate-binding protein
MWNGLTKYDADMNIQPDLAERWEIVDSQTFVFYLRQGVTFHNGRELVADDVKFSIERVQNPEFASRFISSVDKIASVEVVDPHTVKINLSKPNVIQHLELVNIKIVPQEAIETINTNPVGTGPYSFVEFVPGDHLSLRKYDGYWNQPFPYPNEFVIRIVKDDTSLYNAFKAGQFDLIWQLRFEDTEDAEASDDIWVVAPKISGNSMILQYACELPPFNNKLARQALLYATDKETIFDLAYFQLGWLSPTNSSLVPNHWAFDSTLAEYPYDIEMAKNLFREAGVPEGYTIRYNAISGLWRSWIVQAEIMERSLQECGIKLDIRPVDLSEWVALRAPGTPQTDLLTPNGNERAWDPAEQLKGFRSNEPIARVGYANPEVDDLMDQGLAETDQEKRKAIYAQVQQIVHEDVPWITTHHRPINHAAWNHIQGVYVDGQGDLHLDELYTQG